MSGRGPNAPPDLDQRPQKRSFTLSGHRTSITLEAAFWDEFESLAADLDLSRPALVDRIDRWRGPDVGLSSALRLFVLQASLRKARTGTFRLPGRSHCEQDVNEEAEMAENKGEIGGNAQKDPATWTTGEEPMTGAQKSYLQTLCEEAGEEMDDSLSKAEASRRIDALQDKTGRGS